LGFVIGVLAVFVGVVTSGSDIMDVIVPSAIIVVLSLLWLPAAPRMKAQRLRKKGIVPTQVQKTSAKPTNNGLTRHLRWSVKGFGGFFCVCRSQFRYCL